MPEGPEGNGVATTPEIKKVPEARDSREKVVEAFHSAFSLLDNTPDEQLTEEERWAKNSIQKAKEETLDQGKSTFTNTFENLETGEVYTQEEGIPVENLFDFMRKKLANLPPNSREWQDIINWGHILYRNSQFYSSLPHRMQPERLLARNRQEANLISKDVRATGTMDGDWYKAEATLNKRIEFVLPTETQLQPPVEPETIDGTTEFSAPFEHHRIHIPRRPPPSTEEELAAGPAEAPPEPVEPETPSPSEPSTSEPQPVEDVRREFVIINRTVDIRKRAAELAEEQLRNGMRRGSGWNPLNWPRKIALRVAEQFYRQRFIERASHSMLDNNNSYLDMDVVRNAVRDANANIYQERQAGKEKVEQIKTGEQMAGQRVVEAQGQLKTILVNEVLRPVVDGTITDQAQIQDRLRQFVQTHQNDPDVQAVFGADATQYGRLAEYFASDLLEMGDLVKQDLTSHRYALEQLDQHVSIKLANASWAAETQAQFNATDRAVAWAQSRRLTGWLINPATIGAASSLASFGLLRMAGVTGSAAQVITPGIGTLLGAGFAAVRRNYDLKVDRATHQVERAYNRRIPPTGAPRREALERFTYETVSVNELLNGGGNESLTGTARRNLQELLRQDLSSGQASNREVVVRRIAEIKSRLDFSARERVDLVTFEAREQVEQGRLGLVRGVVEARQVLRNAGMSGDEIQSLETLFTGEWTQRFTQNREQQDRNFAHFRLRNALGAGVFGGTVGLGAGLLTQEGITVGQRLAGAEVGQTVIEKGLGALGIHVGETAPTIPPPSGIAETLKNLYQQEGSADVGNLQANVGPDHAVSIIDKATGQPIPDIPKLVLEVDGHMNATGDIPQNLRDELQQSGFQIDQGPDITEPGRTITEQQPVLGPDGEWTKHSTNVHHREWYSYDQPGSQGNELRFYTRQDGQAVILDINNMKLGYQRGLVPNPIDVQQVIKNHEAVWYFTTPNLPQDGIGVSDGADGVWDGKLRLDPNIDPSLKIDPNDSNSMSLAEFSKMVLNQEALKIPPGGNAIEVYSRQDVFNLGQDGKFGFIEAGRIQPRAEGNVLQTFATIRGASPVPEFVEVPKMITPEPISTFEITPPVTEAAPPTEAFEAPPIIPIPFAPRHPLESLVPPLPPEYYHRYPEREFPAGARLVDILRRGLPTAGELRQTYRAEGEVVVDHQEGQRALEEARRAFEAADSAYVVLGGAIGDAVIATAYLQSVQEALRQAGKNVPITVVVSEGHGDLFDGFTSRNIQVVKAPRGQGFQAAMEKIASSSEIHPLVIDLEHYRIENPTIETKQQADKTITTLHNLLAPAVQLYNNSTDQERRFADYVEDLFSLPRNSINSERAMPRVELPQDKDTMYENLLGRFGIDRDRPQIAVVVESQIAEKRYPMDRWASVVSQISQQNPQYQFNIIVNPQSQAAGFTRIDIENSLRTAGVLENSHIVSGSLLEMAVLLERQNLVLSNDTGLAHIATALENGQRVVSLHLPYFPPNSWVANPKKQTGILPPEGEVNIAGIPPENVVRQALELLQATAPVAVPAPQPTPTIPRPQRPSLFQRFTQVVGLSKPPPLTAPPIELQQPPPLQMPSLGTWTREANELLRRSEALEATMAEPETSPVSGVGFSEDANLGPGKRSSMEDAHTVVENFGGKPDQSFFAIYDGHGGREVADFAATRLHENLLQLLQAGASPTVALKTAYQTTDDQITLEKIKQDAGATAVTALIQGNKLYIANAGDARAVLDRGGQATRLTYDHKATDAAEMARIEALGGRVEDGYVQNQLAVARALGDRYLRPYVITEPQQSEIDLTSQDQTLILACDGVWDVISDQEAVDLIRNEPDPQRASEVLKNEALTRGSTDNISVLVIGLKPPETTAPSISEEARAQAQQAAQAIQELMRHENLSEEEARRRLLGGNF